MKHKHIRIGTRASKLALVQTQGVVSRLQHLWPQLDISVQHIRTKGDHLADVPLSLIGGDGVFVAEMERALAEGRIDLAVHSLKDLPTVQPDHLYIAVIGPREDARDVYISRFTTHEEAPFTSLCKPGLSIGTGSMRREAQLRAWCHGVQILPLRGNVDTRLRKLAAGDYDGIVLAAAGLRRLNVQAQLAGRLHYFPLETLLPAPGQGAIALETRAEQSMLDLLLPLIDRRVEATTCAERMFMRRMGAGCYLPVAAYAEVDSGALKLTSLVISLDGQRQVRVNGSIAWHAGAQREQAEQLGAQLAEQALAQGAEHIIASLEHTRGQQYD